MEKTQARLTGAAIAGGLELSLFHPVDTVAKRLMASKMQFSVANAPEIVFQETSIGAGGSGAGTFFARAKSLFPGFGYGAMYKISQRVYKYGGQPFIKEFIKGNFPMTTSTKLQRSLVHDGVAGACMGAGEVVLLPFDVLKIKSQTNPTYRGRNMFAVFKQEGLVNLYAGWQWTMIRNVPGSFSLFGVNALVRDCLIKKSPKEMSFMETSISSTAGSLASIIVACPFDVIKTRIQSGRFEGMEGKGLTKGALIAKNIVKEEGFGGFFKGVVPKCSTVGPKLVFSFTIAQYLMNAFQK